jgi:two-component system chemotaxis response regulator CheB
MAGPTRDIVVVGASAGGVEALSRLVADLPPDFPGSVFVVLHVPAHGTSMMPRILSRAGPLPATHPADGEPIEAGRVYVAPPDRHLLLADGRMRVVLGPRENRHRPAVDPLFRSAARWYGPRVVGVVLTGALDDGTAGLLAVKQRGGYAIVQDPDEAPAPGMPASALQHVAVDARLPLSEIAPRLTCLARDVIPTGRIKDGARLVPEQMEYEDRIAGLDEGALSGDGRPGDPSAFSCPDCGGVLWELHDDTLTRYRCRVGHAYSSASLLGSQTETYEAALWTALRALEEKLALSRRLVERARQQGHRHAEARFAEQAADVERHATALREMLLTANTGEERATEQLVASG